MADCDWVGGYRDARAPEKGSRMQRPWVLQFLFRTVPRWSPIIGAGFVAVLFLVVITGAVVILVSELGWMMPVYSVAFVVACCTGIGAAMFASELIQRWKGRAWRRLLAWEERSDSDGPGGL